jgi:hypothetical protein
VREAVSSRRRGSMASEKCGMPTLPLSNKPERDRWDQAGRVGQNRAHPITQAPCTAIITGWGTIARQRRRLPLPAACQHRRPPTPWRPVPSFGRGSLHGVIVRRAPAGSCFRPGTLPARPWRASTPAARGQKPPGHHHPHHQNGHQYQNLPHGKLLLAYGCRSAGISPPTSGASASLRPPLTDGNSVRTPRSRRGALSRNRVPVTPHKPPCLSLPTPARQHAIPLYNPNKRPTLASEPLRKN